MQKFYILVATSNGEKCWVATWKNGDPPRTMLLDNAKPFDSSDKAEKYAQKLKKRYSFDYTIYSPTNNL